MDFGIRAAFHADSITRHEAGVRALCLEEGSLPGTCLQPVPVYLDYGNFQAAALTAELRRSSGFAKERNSSKTLGERGVALTWGVIK